MTAVRKAAEVSKLFEALMNGIEVHSEGKEYIIDEENRAGYIGGDIFYEVDLRGLLEALEKVDDVEFLTICARLCYIHKDMGL